MSKASVTKLETATRRPPMTDEEMDAFIEENQENPAAIYNSEACRFKGGDRVRIVKPDGVEDETYYSDTAGHVSNWAKGMDDLIGKELVLDEEMHGPNGWHVVREELAGLPPQLALMLGGIVAFIEDWLEPADGNEPSDSAA